jgi:hypothetical protein
MTARSIAGQQSLIQKEVTPGTPLTTAMLRLTNFKLRPGFAADNTPFRGGTGKVVTGIEVSGETGPVTVEGIQDYNHLGYALSSRVSLPVTTTPGGGTLSRQHVFTLNPDAEDTKATYTYVWGDATQAVQGVYAVFNSLSMNIQRGSLDFGTSMMGRLPTTGATIPGSGITTVPAKQIAARNYNVYLDSTWAGKGTTKLLDCYEANLDLGDKFATDAPIDSTVSGFRGMLEAEEQDMSARYSLGFDAVALASIASFQAGSWVFFTIKSTGPIIEAAIPYSLQIDMALLITSPGEFGAAPNSPAVVVPFEAMLAKDPVSNQVLMVTLVNTVISY